MAIDWEGGAVGAGTGAAVGSLGGPIGTAIGGGAGFLIGSGMLGGGLQGTNKRHGRRQTLQVNPGDQQRQLQARQRQSMWNAELQRRAMGQGPSVAEQQMAAGAAQAQAAAAGQAASARGGNPALAQRSAATAGALGAAAANRDAGMLRAQEMQTAGQTYAAQLDNQRMADLQARGMSIDEAKAQLDADKAAEAAEAARAQANTNNRQQFLGGMLSMGGSALGLSDVRAKENVTPLYSDFADKEAPSFGEQLRVALTQNPNEARLNPQPDLPVYSARPSGLEGNKEPVIQVQPKEEKKDGGLLGGLLSDKQSKEKIRDLKEERDAYAMAAQREAVKSHLDRVPSMWQMPPSALRLEGRQAAAPQRVAMVSDYTDKELLGQLQQVQRQSNAGTVAPIEYPGDDLDRLAKEADARRVGQVDYPITAQENRAAFEPIRPVAYQYKPEASARMAMETGETPAEQAMVYEDKRTPRAGIIAQDLERSPAYADAVVETPAGKAVDRDRALSETLAQAAGFDKRLRELEAYLKSKGAKKLDRQAKVTPVQPRGM